MNGIQEVSGSIPLISTKKDLKSQDFRSFFALAHREIPQLPNIVGMFWYNAKVSVHGGQCQLHLVVIGGKNHKQTVELRFSSVRC